MKKRFPRDVTLISKFFLYPQRAFLYELQSEGTKYWHGQRYWLDKATGKESKGYRTEYAKGGYYMFEGRRQDIVDAITAEWEDYQNREAEWQRRRQEDVDNFMQGWNKANPHPTFLPLPLLLQPYFEKEG